MDFYFSKTFHLIILILFWFQFGYSQNQVPNPSFEDYKITKGPPTDNSQIENLRDWINFETADFISDKDGEFNMTYLSFPGFPSNCEYLYSIGQNRITAHTGNYFVGFGDCEGIQVKLKNKLKFVSNSEIAEDNRGKYVQISFWYLARNVSTVDFNVYLLENSAPEQGAIGNCLNPNIDQSTTQNFHIENIQPGTWYKYTSKPILLDAGKEYEWFAIKGRNVEINNGEGHALSSCGYTCIDDVEIKTYNVCDLPCVNKDEITHGSYQNAMYTGPSVQKYHIYVKNAMGIRLSVYNNGDNLIYERLDFNSEGLKDEGYEDYYFSWNGKLANGTFPQEDVHVYKIEIWNCSEIVEHTSQLTILDGGYDPEEIEFNVGHFNNHINLDCCEDHYIIQNMTLPPPISFFPNTMEVRANSYILAGENVDSSVPNGDVIIRTGGDVTFKAQSVILKTGFVVQNGAIFHAISKDCVSGLRKGFEENRIDNNVESSSTLLNNSEDIRNLPKCFSLNFNNTTKEIELKNTYKNSDYQFVIIDAIGKIVEKRLNINTEESIKLWNLDPGVYFIRFTNIKTCNNIFKFCINQ